MDSGKKCSHKGYWIALILLGAVLFVSLALNGGLLIGLMGAGDGKAASRGEDEYPDLKEIWSYGSGDAKAVRIAIEGAIFRRSEDSLFGMKLDRIESILQQIRAAKNDKDVRAIVLEVNSPGGELTASDEIYEALKDFKATKGRKIVVYVKDMAASGGYYVSMPGDWIIAEPTAIVGSIGVIMQSLNIKGLSEKIGITDVTIKTGTNKDLLNPFHDTPPEQLALLQTMIDTMYARFLGVVEASRKIDEATLRPIADGRVFSAEDALKHGLVDATGYWEDALAKTRELTGETKLKFVRYESRKDFFQMLSEIRSPLRLPDAAASGPRFLYLWQP